MQVYYDGDDNEGTLKIVPNYDIESPYYTPVCINDGFHRQTALIEEFVKQRKEGKDFNFRMILLINVINEYKAKRYTEDTFKASIPSKEVLNNFKPSTTNNFVDKIIENSKYGEIYKMWKDAKKVKISESKPNGVYYVHHGAKVRYIDPLIKGKRISDICKIAKGMIEKNLSYNMENYVFLTEILDTND